MTPKLYKATEVCEITGLQSYVLRSWEKEFPGIGVQKSPDLRLYRQSDLDQVARIKELVFSEGLTLAGARRRLESSSPSRAASPDVEMAEVLEALGTDARARIAVVRSGLRSILDALSKTPGAVRIADLPPAEGRGNGGGSARAKANGRAVGSRGTSADRRGGPSGPPKKAKAATKRTVASKRGAATRKPARNAKRKRAGA